MLRLPFPAAGWGPLDLLASTASGGLAAAGTRASKQFLVCGGWGGSGVRTGEECHLEWREVGGQRVDLHRELLPMHILARGNTGEVETRGSIYQSENEQ